MKTLIRFAAWYAEFAGRVVGSLIRLLTPQRRG